MTSSANESIVLTGCGWVTPFAAGTIIEVLEAALTGPSPPPTSDYWAIPDDLLGEYPDLSRELESDKGAWVTAIAFEHACRQAARQPDTLEPQRVGMVLGYGLAGQLGMINFANEVRQQSPRFVSPIHFPQTVGNYLAGALARACDIRGPNVTLASGPGSGLAALVEGCAFIASGQPDVVIAGGVDTLSSELAQGFATPDAVLSEGACLFVLEPADRAAARGAVPLARATGGGHASGTVGAIPETGPAILSSASSRHPGAIFIEHWIGRCPGASGPAAVAAAIGAVRQHQVPVIDPADPATVSIERITLDGLSTPDAAVPAVIFADADGAHQTTLNISIPTT